MSTTQAPEEQIETHVIRHMDVSSGSWAPEPGLDTTWSGWKVKSATLEERIAHRMKQEFGSKITIHGWEIKNRQPQENDEFCWDSGDVVVSFTRPHCNCHKQ